MSKKKSEPPVPADIQMRVDQLGPDTTPTEWKDAGNSLFKAGCFTASIKCYTKAIEADEDNHALYSNRSAAYLLSTLRAGPSLAKKDAEKCVTLAPTWFKGHIRLGDALAASGKHEAAIAAYDTSLKLSPGQETALDGKRRCQASIRGDMEGELHGNGTHPGAPAAATPSPTKRNVVPSESEREEYEKNPERFMEKVRSELEEKAAPISVTKKSNVSLENVDRSSAQEYKRNLLSSYRSKIDSDPNMRKKVDEERDRHVLQHQDKYDYRAGVAKETDWSGATDTLGKCISADALASFKYKSRSW